MTDGAATAADIDAVVAARHPDPFAILGPHPTEGGTAVRAFVPDARILWLVPEQGTPRQFTRRHANGFFELVLSEPPSHTYRLRAENDNATWTFRDPYAFASVLGALDDHLLIEGTHRQLYERLSGLGKHVDHLGRALAKAVTSYNQAVGSLESRVLPSARRLNELGVVDGELTAPALVEEAPRALSAPELIAEPGPAEIGPALGGPAEASLVRAAP